MALTPAEHKAIEEGAEQVRRKQEALVEKEKTREFQEMKKRNEARPQEKPMPSSREFIKQKAAQGAERIGKGMVNFITAPNTKPKRQPSSAPRRRAAYPAGAVPPRRRRRAAPRQPPAQQGFFSGGGMGMPSFSGDLLGGWGAPAPRRKKKGGWGLL
jgi:hypothetical protein